MTHLSLMAGIPLQPRTSFNQAGTPPATYLESLNKAVKVLANDIALAKYSDDLAGQRSLIRSSVQRTIQSVNGLEQEISLESDFDLTKLRSLTAKISTAFEKDASFFDKETADAIQHAVEFLKNAETEHEFLNIVPEKTSIKREDAYNQRVSHLGICYGFAHALMDENTSSPILVSPRKRSLERERKARFYQAAIHIQKKMLFSTVPEEIGSLILRKPHLYPSVLKKAAQIFGYLKIEDQFLPDLQNRRTSFSLLAVERLLGKWVLDQIILMYDEVQRQRHKIFDFEAELSRLNQKILQHKKRIDSLTDFEIDNQKKLNDLGQEIHQIKSAIDFGDTPFQIGKIILARHNIRSNIIEKVSVHFDFPDVNVQQYLEVLKTKDPKKYRKVAEYIGKCATQELNLCIQMHKELSLSSQTLLEEKQRLSKEIIELKERASSSMEEIVRLSKTYNPLRLEYDNLVSLLSTLPSLPYIKDRLPTHILKKRGIIQNDPLIVKAPLAELTILLEPHVKKEGEIIFTLYDSKEKAQHSIYINFKRLFFCDINDKCFETDLAKIRTCSTSQELLDELSFFLSETYKGAFPLFSLWHYEKTASSSMRSSSNV